MSGWGSCDVCKKTAKIVPVYGYGTREPLWATTKNGHTLWVHANDCYDRAKVMDWSPELRKLFDPESGEPYDPKLWNL